MMLRCPRNKTIEVDAVEDAEIGGFPAPLTLLHPAP